MDNPLELETLGQCGPAKFFKAAKVLISHYPVDGSTALIANLGTPDKQVYTVCLGDNPAPLKSDHVWLKDWGANEGVPEALEKAGLVKLTGLDWPAGSVTAKEAKLIKKGVPEASKLKKIDCPGVGDNNGFFEIEVTPERK